MGRARKKVPRYKKILFWGLILTLAALLGVGGYYAYSFFKFTGHISHPKNNSVTAGDEWTGTGRVNIALIGADERPGEGPARSDSIIILSIDPETKKASLFSVMRDTYYKIPGYGFHKINEAEALGGPELVKQTVSNYLQLPIHYYVKTNFQGFANIVDVLGGIDMYVEKDMDWLDDGINDIHLKKGQQHLDGKHALMYVRFRHDALSDYTRTERQRNFLSTLAKEMKSANSIVKLPQILDSIQNDVETDMSVTDMLKLGNLAMGLDINNMDSVQLPPLHDSTGTKEALLEATRDGGSVIIPDVYETRLLVHKILNTGQVIVKTDDDQEPMVQNIAQPKTTPTPKTTLPEKQTPTPAVPNPEGKTTPTPGTGTGTGMGAGTGTGTGSGSKPPAGGTNGTGSGSTTPTKSGGTSTTPGTGTGTGGSGSTGGSVTPPGATPPPAGTTNPAAGPGTTGMVPSTKPAS